ncbi:MAG: TRAP transporter small permease [Burkholderiaceae bacterium]|nr:TRAP transporter small permease [Burkholderiaceae bacterium]
MSRLDRIATVAGAVAAVFLALIAAIIAVQIVARLFGRQIPASDDFAAWSMAASIFLALPYAMQRGDHIRVTLVQNFLPKGGATKAYEIVATAIGLALSGWATWHAAAFVYESYAYGDVAQGMVAVPLWIPQVAMPIGLALLTAMLVQRLLKCLRGEALEEDQGHG